MFSLLPSNLRFIFLEFLGLAFFRFEGFSAGANPPAIWFGISNASVTVEGTIRKQWVFPSIPAAKTVDKHHLGAVRKKF